MAFIRRAFLSLKRRYTRTLILFAILLIIGAFEAAGLLLSNAAKSAKNETLWQLGPIIDIGNNQKYMDELNQQAIASGNVITGSNSTAGGSSTFTIPITTPAEVTDAMIEKLEKVPNVIGINYTSGNNGIPINFSNVKDHEGVDPATQKVNMPASFVLNDKDDVMIDGDARVDLLDVFRKKEARVIEGVFPTEKNPGALIEERLAAKNNLKPGDTIQVAPAVKVTDKQQGERISRGDAEPIAIKIIGIFRTTEKFEILDTNPLGDGIYAASPYNRIYTDYETGKKISDPGTRMEADIYIDSPENLNNTAAKIKKLDFDWNKYEIDLNSMYHSDLLNPIDAVSSYAFTVNLIATLIGAVILLLIMSLWSKNYVYETGLLLSLGEKKWKIIAQHITEVVIVAAAAFVIAGLIGVPVARRLGGQAINPVTNTGSASVASYDTGTTVTQQPIEIKASLGEALGVAGIGIVLVLVSTAVPGMLILKYKPRKILSKSE